MSIQARLVKYPVPDSVWDEYHLDQEINDRGVGLDMELVQKAIEMDGRSRTELTQAMKDLTALENPNSVQQMKQWLSVNGICVCFHSHFDDIQPLQQTVCKQHIRNMLANLLGRFKHVAYPSASSASACVCCPPFSGIGL